MISKDKYIEILMVDGCSRIEAERYYQPSRTDMNAVIYEQFEWRDYLTEKNEDRPLYNLAVTLEGIKAGQFLPHISYVEINAKEAYIIEYENEFRRI